MNDELDDLLRSRLQKSEPTVSSDAHHVLAQLQPAMRRARIRRGMAVGTAVISLLGVCGIGLAAVTMSTRREPSEVDILIDDERLPEPTPPTTALEPTEIEEGRDKDLDDEQTATPTPLPASTPTTLAHGAPATIGPTTSTTLPRQATPVSTMETPNDNDNDGTTSVSSAPVTQPAPPTTSPTPTTDPPSSPASTTPATTVRPATTMPATTAPTPSGQRTIQSNCGSINISFSGSSITLTDNQPAAGFASDIKNSGPEKVEVGFSDGTDECEIKAWVESGQLRTDIANHDGAEDDDDHDG